MSKKKTKAVTPKPDPNQLLHQFLTENKLVLNVDVMEGRVPFVGDGFVITDKPLLKVKASYQE